MSSLRRSARLAAKAASKSVPQQERSWQQELSTQTKDVIAKGLLCNVSTLNSVQIQAEIDYVITQTVPHAEKKYVVPIDKFPLRSSKQERSPQEFWTLKYTRLSDQANLKDQATLNAAIIEHEKRCDDDMWHDLDTTSSIWEYELNCAVRWLCIDNRILKESVVMRDKARQYAHRVNALLRAHQSRRDSLREQSWKATGHEADKLSQELLKADLLSAVAHHVHDKFNCVMNEIVREMADWCDYCLLSEVKCPLHGSDEPFKPEMPIDSDDEY
jgi:hypothetical protein